MHSILLAARLSALCATLALLVIAGCAGLAPFKGGAAASSSGAEAGVVRVGAPAPDFTFTAFDGTVIRPEDLRGKAVVLNFWASWCVPCRAEMPDFERAYQALRQRGVAFLGVAVMDDDASSRAFLDELHVTFPAGPDASGEIARRYQVRGLPVTAFIDRQGHLARLHVGQVPEPQLDQFLRDIAS